MKYEKAYAERINFGGCSFLTASPSEEEQAIAAAEAAALAAYGGGNPQIVPGSTVATPVYNEDGSINHYIVETTVSNHGGQHRKSYRWENGQIEEI